MKFSPQRFYSFLPGILLALVLAIAGLYGARWSLFKQWGLSASILSIAGGIVFGNTVYHFVKEPCQAGINFTKQRVLRLAIILFGLKLTFQDIAAVGFAGVFIDALIVCCTFGLTIWVAQRFFNLDKHNAILIGSGCSICGAAAIMATSPIIKADSDKVAIAVACIVIFGTISMFVYPFLYQIIPLSWNVSEFEFGVFTGSTIHEVAQVAAAGQAVSPVAANSAVIVKMIRVLMLVPFLFALSAWQVKSQRDGKSQIVVPWFAVGFLVMACISTWGILPTALTHLLIQIDDILLTAAMGALGVTTHFSAFRQAGVKPLLLVGLMSVWLIGGGALINIGVFKIFS